MRSGMGSDAFRACVVKGVSRGGDGATASDSSPAGSQRYSKSRLCDYFVTVGSRVATVLGCASASSLSCCSCCPPPPPPIRTWRRTRRCSGAGRAATTRGTSPRSAAVGQASRRLQLLHLLEGQRFELPLARLPPRRRRAAGRSRDAVGLDRQPGAVAQGARSRRRRPLPGRAEPPARREGPGRLPAPAVGDEQRQQPLLRLRPVGPPARRGLQAELVQEGLAAAGPDRPRRGRRDDQLEAAPARAAAGARRPRSTARRSR